MTQFRIGDLISSLIKVSTLFLVFYSQLAQAQQVKGIVLDKATGEALPFANVSVVGTSNGASTEMDGTFLIEQEELFGKTLLVEYIGYVNKEFKIQNIDNPITIELEVESQTLSEVVIKPDFSYDRYLYKKILKNRKRNNPEEVQSVEYDEYTRTSVFLSNLNKSISKSRLFRGAEDAFIAKSDSTVMMPFFMSERLVSKKYDGNWDEQLVSENSEGLMSKLNDEVETILSTKLTNHVNFYDSQINIMERGFPSPISESARLFYNIYLVDSTDVQGAKRYRFDFYPKNYKNIAFKGHFWVEDGSFALTEVEAQLPNSANVNFVSNFNIAASYKKMDDGSWYYKDQKIRMNLAPTKSSEEDSRVFDVQKVLSIEVREENEDSIVAIRPSESSTSMADLRPIPMDSFEAAAFEGISKLKSTSIVKQVDKLGSTALTGYYDIGIIDVGPFFEFYQSNRVEGSRISLPLRTNEKLFKDFSVGGYVGYGIKDKKFKYGATVQYKLPIEKRTILSLAYRDDYLALSKNKFSEFVRENPFSKGSGNVITTFTTTANPHVLRQQRLSLTMDYQWRDDIGVLLRPFHTKYLSNEFVRFDEDNVRHPSFTNTGVMLNMRFSFGQDYDEGYFSRFYYGNQKPVINLTAIYGKTKMFNNKAPNNDYLHLNLSLKSKVNIGPAFVRMLFDGGYIIGDVPYPLLHMPRGTEGLGFARYHFNLLHHSSFASDAYANAHLSFNGGGTLFNHVPLLKRLNLREIVSFKSHFGRLRSAGTNRLKLPLGIIPSTKYPYAEVGVGVGNIFKCLRVEYVRRLNTSKMLDKISAKHGVRLRVEMVF